MTNPPLTRRDLLRSAAAGTSAAFLHRLMSAAEPAKLPRVAAINSIYRLRSHAYHIAGRFIYGYTINGEHHQPAFELVRMFNHQSPADDLGPRVCRQHGIELCKTIAEALGGENSLDVDAVLLIIEHGEYPVNEFGQIEYPRFELFQEVVDVFRKSGRSVPVFVDKHLSYNHEHAHEMVRTAREMKFGLMAGSSLPVVWRRPEYDPPLETPFTEGLVVFGYDRGPQEIYLIHALETLQCLLERRRGGETGVKSVVGLRGDAVWKAGDEGLWSWDVLEAALVRNPSTNYGKPREQVLDPSAILIEYADGTRGAVLNMIEACSENCFAGRIAGLKEIPATWFVLPQPPGARFFDPQTYNIEKFFANGTPPYPVERTLLTSTVLDLALLSMHDGGKKMTGESLNIRYQAPVDPGNFHGRWTDA
jgi:hypothetical protein